MTYYDPHPAPADPPADLRVWTFSPTGEAVVILGIHDLRLRDEAIARGEDPDLDPAHSLMLERPSRTLEAFIDECGDLVIRAVEDE